MSSTARTASRFPVHLASRRIFPAWTSPVRTPPPPVTSPEPSRSLCTLSQSSERWVSASAAAAASTSPASGPPPRRWPVRHRTAAAGTLASVPKKVKMKRGVKTSGGHTSLQSSHTTAIVQCLPLSLLPPLFFSLSFLVLKTYHLEAPAALVDCRWLDVSRLVRRLSTWLENQLGQPTHTHTLTLTL